MDDMVRAIKVMDDEIAFEALANMPPGLPEPIMPERISVSEAKAVLERVCSIAEQVLNDGFP